MNAGMNPFEIALGIQKPWKITDTQLIPSEKNPDRLEMHIYVDFEEGTRLRSARSMIRGKGCGGI